MGNVLTGYRHVEDRLHCSLRGIRKTPPNSTCDLVKSSTEYEACSKNLVGREGDVFNVSLGRSNVRECGWGAGAVV